MLSSPRSGQSVQVWYAKKKRAHMPLHGQVGQIEVVSRARRCRNHGVRIDGRLYSVPAGNLRTSID